MLTLKRRQNEWRRTPAPQERLHRESEHARRSLREVGDALQRVRSLRKRRLVHSRYRPALPDGHGLVPQLESGCYALSLTQQTEANMSLLTDRKSTRLNSSHGYISYAVFCLKK